jgi:hypothetical protein
MGLLHPGQTDMSRVAGSKVPVLSLWTTGPAADMPDDAAVRTENRTHGHRSEICESAVLTIVLEMQRDRAD